LETLLSAFDRKMACPYVLSTDNAGEAIFTVPEGLSEGELQLTAHKHNYIPYLEDVEVSVSEVNLVLGEYGLDDSDGDEDVQ